MHVIQNRQSPNEFLLKGFSGIYRVFQVSLTLSHNAIKIDLCLAFLNFLTASHQFSTQTQTISIQDVPTVAVLGTYIH